MVPKNVAIKITQKQNVKFTDFCPFVTNPNNV